MRTPSIFKVITQLGLAILLAMMGACSDPEPTLDAGPDAGEDAGPDAGEDAGEDASDDSSEPSPTYTFVLDSIGVPPTAAGGQAPGFDLDDQATHSIGGDACQDRHLDFISPTGQPGVDNQFVGSVIDIVRDFVPSFSPQRALQAEMQRGRLLLGVRLRDVDDLVNDDDIALDLIVVRPSSCEEDLCPLTTSIAATEGWRVHNEDVTSEVRGSISNGRLMVYAETLPVSFPVDDILVDLTIHHASFAADITSAGLRNGAFGGAVEIEETVALANSLRSGTGGLVRATLQNSADVEIEEECNGLSIGAAFAGVSATF